MESEIRRTRVDPIYHDQSASRRGSICLIMVSIRSNLNSVCNVSEGLLVLKKRLATCFKVCRRLTHQTTKTTKQHFYEEHQHFFTQPTTFNEKTIKNLQLFNTRLRNIFVPKKSRDFEPIRLKRDCDQKCEDHEVKIVAKLLSSTVLATTTVTTTAAYADFIQDRTDLKEEITFSLNNSEDMTVTSNTFLEIRDEFPDLESEVRSILMAHAQTGATICEIKDDYKKITGLYFPVYNNVTEFLLSIPWVSAYCNENFTRIFNIMPTEKTKHLHNMITTQKPQAMKPNSIAYGQRTGQQCGNRVRSICENNDYKNNNANYHYGNKRKNHINENDCATNTKIQRLDRNSESVDSGVENKCYYEDNIHYLQKRFNADQQGNNVNNNLRYENNMDIINKNTNVVNKETSFQPRQHQQPAMNPPFRQIRPRLSWSPTATRSSEYNASISTHDSEFEAHLLDFPLLGDDFFLYLARMELKCKFKKHEKILQAGLCASGQTIAAATRRIRHLDIPSVNRSIIVNIGSVDIMQERPLVQIEHDFRELINVMHKNDLKPILTTLAPLANYSHIPQVKETVERFNEFIKREGRSLVVVDIWACLVNKKRQVLFDCFQNEPRQVTGTPEPYVFWNKIGRQRVLQMITSNIEY